MSNLPNDLENSLAQIKVLYIAKLKDSIQYYKDILNYPLNIELLEDLKMKIHKLSGSAGMYGFSELSIVTHKLDLLLDDMVNNRCKLDKTVIKPQICGIINMVKNL